MFINTYINDLHISEGDSYEEIALLCKGRIHLLHLRWMALLYSTAIEYRVGQKEKFLWVKSCGHMAILMLSKFAMAMLRKFVPLRTHDIKPIIKALCLGGGCIKTYRILLCTM